MKKLIYFYIFSFCLNSYSTASYPSIDSLKEFKSTEFVGVKSLEPSPFPEDINVIDKELDLPSGVSRLKDIDDTATKIENTAHTNELYIFLGRSVSWIYEALNYKISQGYTSNKNLCIKQVYFSGASKLSLWDNELYTEVQEKAYQAYLESIGITPKTLSTYQEIKVIDFIMAGRTMKIFSKLLKDWFNKENIEIGKISYIDITFTPFFSERFKHSELLGHSLKQIFMPASTLHILIHANKESPESIGKNNTLVPYFDSEIWEEWQQFFTYWKPSPKALRMQVELHNFLDFLYKPN